MQLAYGARDAFNALVYGEQNPVVTDFLRSRYENLSNIVLDSGREFAQNAMRIFEHFNGNAAIDFARKAVQSLVNGGAAPEIQRIIFLADLQALQSANTVMQRWLMANPTVREPYLKQRLDGYSDTYVNMHGSAIGWRHYDYQLATNGLMVVSDEPDDHEVRWTMYGTVLHQEDRELLFGEQLAIRDCWNVQNVLQAMGFDTTDPTGGQL